MEDFDTFAPDELMPLVPHNFLPGTFLRRVFFGTGLTLSDRAEVFFDRILPDKRMAPFVAPLAPGRILQPKGYQRESIIPASLKPKNQITADQVMTRLPGEAIGGDMSAADRAAQIRENYLTQHQEYFARRDEWMASSLLRTGAVTIVGDDYPSTVVDFARLNTLTKTLLTTARWGETGVSPHDDVDQWANEVGTACGTGVDIVLMDRKAWALYKADPKTKDSLDTTLGQTVAMSLGLTPGVPGSPAFKGRDGNIEFYVYNDNYEDDDGNSAQLLPDYTVILGSRGGIAGTVACGVVQHAENNFQPGEFFPHEWIDPNTGAHWVETIGSRLLVPRRVNGSLCATVR